VSARLIRTVEVLGTPRPQGSMRLFKNGGAKYADNVYVWRNLITTAVQAAGETGLWEPFTGAVALRCSFYLARPLGHSGKRGLLPSAPATPAKAPDLDKLVRLVGDALTDAGCMWKDDGQVTTSHARKLYADGRPPGVVIEVWEEE
jgi:Holliday junction resolvase RusA-like endonuclease